MNDITKGVIISVVSAAIGSISSYAFLARDNNNKISNIEKELGEFSDAIRNSGNSIDALKLFVVSAHPDRDYIPLTSARKLGKMNPSELAVLAFDLSKNQDEVFDPHKTTVSTELTPIVEKHGLTMEDLKHYFNVVHMPGLTSPGT